MDNIAKLSISERRELFLETSVRSKMHPAIVEKDFWVCWILKQLFSIEELDEILVFKGGTSLSKCFNLIRRFSEDIDLAVDYKSLGYTDKKDPCLPDLSQTKRVIILREMLCSCQEFIKNELVPVLFKRIRNVIGNNDWQIEIDSVDNNILYFDYPLAVESGLDYIKPRIVLELGTHAEPIPNEKCVIKTFTSDHFPTLFSEPIFVTTVVAKRTFWEKATILHAEFYRAPEKKILPRYSRHYADVAEMGQGYVFDEALADIDLLEKVITHKDRFYHCSWAKYDQALPGTFRLVPPKERVAGLKLDYRAMTPMYYLPPLDFEEILDQLRVLEDKINSI